MSRPLFINKDAYVGEFIADDATSDRFRELKQFMREKYGTPWVTHSNIMAAGMVAVFDSKRFFDRVAEVCETTDKPRKYTEEKIVDCLIDFLQKYREFLRNK